MNNASRGGITKLIEFLGVRAAEVLEIAQIYKNLQIYIPKFIRELDVFIQMNKKVMKFTITSAYYLKLFRAREVGLSALPQ